MNIEEAFAEVTSALKAARDKGIKPSIRVSGKDWVCSLEDTRGKYVAIAKEDELLLVMMQANKGEPDVRRIKDPHYTQASFIERIKEHLDEG
jgi:hypothetical protein